MSLTAGFSVSGDHIHDAVVSETLEKIIPKTKVVTRKISNGVK